MKILHKPIFHCKLGSRWSPNANEMYMANAKILRWGPNATYIFHWLALGFCAGGNAIFMFRAGGNANFSVFRYQHVGIPNTIFRVGGLSQRECFHVAVEYRT